MYIITKCTLGYVTIYFPLSKVQHDYCAVFVALFAAVSGCTFYLKVCCISP